MTSTPVGPATDAVLSRLRSTGLPVGDSHTPASGGWQGVPGASPHLSYIVLYPINHNRQGPDASIADRGTDPQLRYQTTCVGIDRRSAERAADLAAGVLLNGIPLDIPGRSTVLLIHESSQGVQRDEDVNPPLFYVTDRWRLDTSHP